jgi:hypothetical protein
MNWQDDTSVWHQIGSYGRTRQFLIPVNTKNNIMIRRPIANDTAKRQYRLSAARACSAPHQNAWILRWESLALPGLRFLQDDSSKVIPKPHDSVSPCPQEEHERCQTQHRAHGVESSPLNQELTCGL